MSDQAAHGAGEREAAAVRRALVLIVIGLVPTLICTIRVTPATFVAFAAIGAPLVGIGALLFVRAVWRALREREAL